MSEETRTTIAMVIAFGTCFYLFFMAFMTRFHPIILKYRIVYNELSNKYRIQGLLLDFHLPIPTLEWDDYGNYYGHIDITVPIDFDSDLEAQEALEEFKNRPKDQWRPI